MTTLVLALASGLIGAIAGSFIASAQWVASERRSRNRRVVSEYVDCLGLVSRLMHGAMSLVSTTGEARAAGYNAQFRLQMELDQKVLSLEFFDSSVNRSHQMKEIRDLVKVLDRASAKYFLSSNSDADSEQAVAFQNALRDLVAARENFVQSHREYFSRVPSLGEISEAFQG
jgi:hypothetical protein